MNDKQKVTGLLLAAMAVTVAIGLAAATNGGKDVSQKSSESSVVTNDNGSVSRSFTECTITTNGSMVTEHRRETRTTLDNEGNMLESSTSEYAQSYPVGNKNGGFITVTDAVTGDPIDGVETQIQVEVVEGEPQAKLASTATNIATAAASVDSFLGLKFGSEFKAKEFLQDPEEPTLRCAKFTPKKKLAGFDDYFAYVTPKTHKVVKVYACAKKAVEPSVSWRRHYLIEALEKRYQTWARPRSAFRPVYSFDLGGGRYITTVLSGATPEYGTVIAAWDDAMLTVAADETEAIRMESVKAAAEKRNRRVKDAADAF